MNAETTDDPSEDKTKDCLYPSLHCTARETGVRMSPHRRAMPRLEHSAYTHCPLINLLQEPQDIFL
jgi:hypothetical protein